MIEKAKKLLEETKNQMLNSLAHYEKELTKVRAGKASPAMLDNLNVDYYGTMTPLSQVANITTPDPKTIIVQPWDRNMLAPIEKLIMIANLGFNPKNDGNVLRITVPPLTEERRKELVKKAKQETENAKVVIRNLRRDANEVCKKLEKDGLPEDSAKALNNDIQKITDEYIGKIDKIFASKEKDIMTV